MPQHGEREHARLAADSPIVTDRDPTVQSLAAGRHRLPFPGRTMEGRPGNGRWSRRYVAAALRVISRIAGGRSMTQPAAAGPADEGIEGVASRCGCHIG